MVWAVRNTRATTIFSDSTVIASGVDVASVVAADLDGDDDLDLVVASYDDGRDNDNSIIWYENVHLLGLLWVQHTISSSVIGARSVSVVDMNGDGILDVLAAGDGGEVIWYQNDGMGDFSVGNTVSDDVPGARWVIGADLDGDGKQDIIAVAFDDNRVTWFQNATDDGTSTENDFPATNGVPHNVAVADVDGDGDLDVVSSSREDSRIVWFENVDGQGDFVIRDDVGVVLGSVTSVAVADVDGAGNVDLISASEDNGYIYAYFNIDGNGTFSTGVNVGVLDSPGRVAMIATDLDGDGDMDLLAASTEADNIVLYVNAGDGTFSPEIIAADGNVNAIQAADMDGDGYLDVVSASWYSDSIAWCSTLVDRERLSSPAPSTPSPLSPTTPAPFRSSTPPLLDPSPPPTAATGEIEAVHAPPIFAANCTCYYHNNILRKFVFDESI